MKIGPFVSDSDSHTIYYRGQSISLTRTEFTVFRELAAQAGRLVRREDLCEKLWSGKKPIQARTIDLHISHIRRKLQKLNFRSVPTIQTVWSLGYRLRLPSPPKS
jgi:DNA-binding response OmpR family regulator